MDIKAYISSGILEQYCLGLIPDAERVEVEQYAAAHPAVKHEIDSIGASLEMYARANHIPPAVAVKTRLLLTAYEEESGTGKKYPPFITKNSTAQDFMQWVDGKNIPSPGDSFDNLYFYDMPSTDAVTNFMVWAKQGHEEEEHNEFREFVVILEGHCDMYMNGEKKHYTKGEIIRIPPLVPHYAVITSEEPMIAIVQRQLIAA